MHSPIAYYVDQLGLLAHGAAETRAELHSAARQQRYTKGQAILTHGMPMRDFLIVLSGQAKIYRAGNDGQQLVLSLAKPGDMLAISAIFNACVSPVSVEAVGDVSVLAIPARLLRQLAARDPQLAYNLLQELAKNSDDYLHQLAQMQLQTVAQRVGNFLLHQFLKTNKKTPSFVLPFDKTMIAAHLGMQPESLSRAFSQLRAKNIGIDRDTISLPHLFALCDYCDPDVAQHCGLHGTPDCPNPQC